MDLTILYEDADIVAVLKPAGLITHSDGRTEGPTAEDWFKAHYPDQGGGYVHRLDRDTSGVLVFAKNHEAYEFLRKAFHDREVKKTYYAIVYGVPRARRGLIDFDIGRSRRDFRLRSAQPKAKGRLREAITRYEVVGEHEGYALVKLQPETGRTHQLRVHLKAIHHPIVCDPLYAPNHKPALGLNRLALHAYEIVLPTRDGKTLHIVCPVSGDLVSVFSQFRYPEVKMEK